MVDYVEVFCSMSIGQFAHILVWVFGGLGVFVATALRSYKIMERYRMMRNKGEQDDATLLQHTETIKVIQEDIKELVRFNNTMVEVSKIQTRNSIVRICNEALDSGTIDSMQLQSLEDLYNMYVNVLNGNSYVSSLVEAVRKLRVCVRK